MGNYIADFDDEKTSAESILPGHCF